MDPAHLLGEPRQARVVELESRGRDEVATEAAAPAIDQALGFDRAQCLPQRHPADPQRVGDLHLGRQLVAGRQRAGHDQLLEPAADAHMSGQISRAGQVRTIRQQRIIHRQHAHIGSLGG